MPPLETLAFRRASGWLHRRPRGAAGADCWQDQWAGSASSTWARSRSCSSNAFFSRDAFTGHIIHTPTLDNFVALTRDPYPQVTLRTLVTAAAVTVACAVLAFPIAYYMARVASPRRREPARRRWCSCRSWRATSSRSTRGDSSSANEGVLNWALEPFGLTRAGLRVTLAVWLVFTYLWLPYMILPVYAGLERIPNSFLEASSDLGGRVVAHLPPCHPAARLSRRSSRDRSSRSSLTLGDYIAPQLVVDHAVHRQPDLRQRRCRREPAAGAPRMRSCRSRSSSSTSSWRASSARSRRCDARRTRAADRVATDDHRHPRVHLPSRSRSSSSTPSTPGRRPSGHPWAFSFRWYGEAIQNTGLQQAFLTSIVAAFGATAIALVLGTLASFGGQPATTSSAAKRVSFVVIFPLALPGIITGMALSATFAAAGDPARHASRS